MRFIAYFKGQELELEAKDLESALKRARAIESAVKELGKLTAIEEAQTPAKVYTSEDFINLENYEGNN